MFHKYQNYYILYKYELEDKPIAIYIISARSEADARMVAYNHGGDYYDDCSMKVYNEVDTYAPTIDELFVYKNNVERFVDLRR